jgi:hypothetical protein
VLQRAGRQGGNHAFRRFRFAVLRKAGIPDGLIKLWLGHSQNLIDLYAAQLRYDETYRRELCEKAGLGFELGELGDKSEDTNSHSWRKTMLKQGLEMVAGSDLN